MFTGIVEEVGKLATLSVKGSDAVLEIEARAVLESTAVGDSISVDGVCLTVTRLARDRFWADAMAETVRRTTLAGKRRGAGLNLERALTLGSRLGGHLVTGHVDGVGTVVRVSTEARTTVLALDVPAPVAAVTVPQGSIAVDGVSLTVVSAADTAVTVSLIPHTVAHTTLRDVRAGASVNLEGDLIGKYVRAYLRGPMPAEGLTWEKLSEAGFV